MHSYSYSDIGYISNKDHSIKRNYQYCNNDYISNNSRTYIYILQKFYISVTINKRREKQIHQVTIRRNKTQCKQHLL